MREPLMFFNASPAKGALFAVGTDMSTIHLLSLVKEPEEVARDAEEGRMMWRPLWPEILTFVASEKLGFRIGLAEPLVISSL
jgi:hypothetical protein